MFLLGIELCRYYSFQTISKNMNNKCYGTGGNVHGTGTVKWLTQKRFGFASEREGGNDGHSLRLSNPIKKDSKH